MLKETPGTNTSLEISVAGINGCPFTGQTFLIATFSCWIVILPGSLKEGQSGKHPIHIGRHLKIRGEHTPRAVVGVGVLAPRGGIIMLLLNSAVVLGFAILMSIPPKPLLSCFQLSCTQEAWEFALNHRHKELPGSPWVIFVINSFPN